eukprot:571755-Pelagomonas_calceolata.AAC.3
MSASCASACLPTPSTAPSTSAPPLASSGGPSEGEQGRRRVVNALAYVSDLSVQRVSMWAVFLGGRGASVPSSTKGTQTTVRTQTLPALFLIRAWAPKCHWNV